ncbi:hypothetical protein HDV01_005174 [Terramyces sp. JEL0728]|nr:hypothetical protein HDV01_005174 [Terramyces sp. JEL0728]
MLSQQPINRSETKPSKSCVIQNGRIRVHTTFPDQTELVEEYHQYNKTLLVRKHKQKTPLGSLSDWIYEVGQDYTKPPTDVSGTNPTLVRQDTLEHFLWRIRNLPYPLETYSVKLNDEKTKIMVRTTNKKYFKIISISDMDQSGLRLDEKNLECDWGSNTLVVMYAKPKIVLDKEAENRVQLGKVKEGNECKQQ